MKYARICASIMYYSFQANVSNKMHMKIVSLRWTLYIYIYTFCNRSKSCRTKKHPLKVIL